MKPYLLQPAAIAAILLAAGCSAPSTTNDQVSAENAADNDLTANDMATAENAAEPSVAIAPPPAAPAGASADDAAPLGRAAQVAREIDSAPDVERVPFEGGWAWRRHGQVLRTASRDGRRISYFRPGESTPFFVQQGEDSFAYAGGHARRAYDRSGHAAPVAPQRRGEADRLADQSRRDRGEAEHAPTPPHREDQGRDRSRDHGNRADQPQPSANASGDASGRGHDRNGGRDRRRDRTSDDDQANRMGRRAP